jgi:SHAQKYF class myb-like DNA-binding protein
MKSCYCICVAFPCHTVCCNKLLASALHGCCFDDVTAVATPKQIRELMEVEGLTNDEVKSHLQVGWGEQLTAPFPFQILPSFCERIRLY